MKIGKQTRIGGQKTLAFLLLACLATSGAAEDWPTFRHDNYRSAATSEQLDAKALTEAWIFRSPHPPQPAWYGPARWDAFAKVKPLRSMRNYDTAFHAIAVGDAVYFGSTAEDCVLRLDARTGREEWRFFTDGPVRIAPAYADGRLYFGSDDGHAYCVTADQGKLVWKFKPSDDELLTPSNGKFISLYPCRTGVLAQGGRAYFAAGLLPWRKSFLCSVDATSGRAEGTPGLYVRPLDGVTMEGALLASPTRIYAAQGRVAPRVFALATGAPAGQLDGGGGVFALITPDGRFMHGPGNKAGWITESNATSNDKIAQHKSGNAMIVTQNRLFMLSDRALRASDRATKKAIWTTPCDTPYALILAGKTLFAGGREKVAAFDAATGEEIWSAAVEGKALGLAVANGALYVSVDTGRVYAYRASSR